MPQLTARHLLFVYGTLKRGYTNWQRYLGIAESHGAAHFVGSAETVEVFPMVIRPEGMAPATRAPEPPVSGDEATECNGPGRCGGAGGSTRIP